MPVMLAAFFIYKQQQIRHEMKEKLEKQYLQTIIVPAKDLVWIKYKKEIRIHNRLFDVKSMILINGDYYLKGLYDDDETELNNFFTKSHERSNDKKTPLVSQLFKLLQSLSPAECAGEFSFQNLRQPFSLSPGSILPSTFAKVLTPPPQI
jgi:hypothetical protein